MENVELKILTEGRASCIESEEWLSVVLLVLFLPVKNIKRSRLND
jgi:hypothetical protein